MSDPVTNVEIEDILSSIRRLVSEDDVPRPGPTREAKRVDRLVLTPSLRVKDQPEPKAAPMPPIILSRATRAREDAAAKGPSLLAQLVQEEVARAMTDRNEDPFGLAAEVVQSTTAKPETLRLSEPLDLGSVSLRSSEDLAKRDVQDVSVDVSEDVDDFDAEVLDAEPLPAAVDEDVDDISLEAMLDDEAGAVETEIDLTAALAEETETPEPSFAVDEALERKIAALEALVRGRSEAPQPEIADDLSEDDVAAEHDAGALDLDKLIEAVEQITEETTEDAIHDEEAVDEDAAEGEDDVSEEVFAEAAETLVSDAEIEARDEEARVTLKLVQQAPEIAQSVESLIEWEDVAPAPEEASQVPQVVEVEEDPWQPAQADADDEVMASQTRDDVPMIDEAMLREMVSDIVRQELQGVLGERITRNVRKLVRREIHRVMMTQDFD